VVVCLARIYVGAHLPLDVLGGIALGLAIGAAVRLAFGRLAR
jgi:glycosyltransferase 2 family protein